MLVKRLNDNPLNKSLAAGFCKKNNAITTMQFVIVSLLNNQNKKNNNYEFTTQQN